MADKMKNTKSNQSAVGKLYLIAYNGILVIGYDIIIINNINRSFLFVFI